MSDALSGPFSLGYSGLLMHRRLLRLPALLAALAVLPPPDAWALGLGRVRGPVLLGRPLNITIPATVEAGDPDAPCIEADVFQGDTRMMPRQVSTRWEPGAQGQGNVRIMSTLPLDEPVLTIYVRVGCSNQVTRRYVLLPEQPTAEAESVPVLPQVPVARAVPAVPQPAPAQLPPAPSAPPLAIQPAQRIATPPASQPAATASKPAPVADRRGRSPTRAPEPAAPAQARLKLEPLDLRYEPEPTLRTSQKLTAEPTADEGRRREAAALWRAITAGPEEAVRNSERISVLERDMRALSDLTRRNAAALELMREQTEKARGERNILAQVAIVLALLLAAGAVAAAWLMRRGSGAPSLAWWGRREAPESEYGSGFDRLQPEPVPAARPKAAPPVAAHEHVAEEADVADSEPPVSRPPVARPSKGPSSRWSHSDFQGSFPGTGSRMLKAEELIDIQQQADFFLSIGQPDRAINVLETHLQQQSETSALAWFDLLDIYHELGEAEEYERIRDGFQQRFNAHVPEFDDYHAEQGGLEDYSRALSRIMTLWPGRRVLEVIEDSLLRRPGSAESETFSLEAYRELVLLYNIAKEVAQEEERDEPRQTAPMPLTAEPAPGARFGETQRLGLYVAPPPAATEPQGPLLGDELLWPPNSPNLGVDIDLSDAFGSAEPPAGAPADDGFDLVLDSVSSVLPDSAVAPEAAPAPTPTPKPLMDLDELDWRSVR
jgi:pilus assembly protein FimV